MSEKDIFADVLRNILEGLMFHNQMIMYFDYMGLTGLADLQRCRFRDENKEMMHLQRYFVECYGTVPNEANVEARNYIPMEWQSDDRALLRAEQKRDFVKFGIETWKDWEDKSKARYSKAYFDLSDVQDAGGTERLGLLVQSVEQELRYVSGLMDRLRGCDYDMIAVVELDRCAVKEYKKFMKGVMKEYEY